MTSASHDHKHIRPSEGYALSIHDGTSGPQFDLAEYLSPEIKRGNAVAEATRVLREAILDGVIPPNAWLREETLTEQIGVSRTPIREALSRLSEEGLVERRSGSGVHVTTLTAEDMSIVYSIRGSLESMAARRIVERASESQLAAFHALHADMAQASKDGDTRQFNRLNVQFHHELAIAADNAYLARLLGTVQVAMRRFGTRSYSADRMEEILHEHQLIIDALDSRDAETAAEAAESHADRARRSTLSRLLGTQ